MKQFTKFEEAFKNGEFRIRTMKWPRIKGQTMVDKAQHRKLMIEQLEPPLKPGGELGCYGRVSVPDPL